MAQLISGINTNQVLEPLCTSGYLKPDKEDWDQRILTRTPNNFLHPLPTNSALWCRVNNPLSLSLSLSLSLASI